MALFRTRGYNCYSVKWSPYQSDLFAVASAANFGLVGNGHLFVLRMTAQPGIQCIRDYTTQDALYDVAFSETNPSHILTSSGDGSLRLFNTDLAPQFPVAVYHEHAREAFSVSWNLISKTNFASSSWDGTVKIWDPSRPTQSTSNASPAYAPGAGSTGKSLLTLPTHSCTYSVAWSPHSADIVSCVSADSHLRVFDLRLPASVQNHLAHLKPIHSSPSTAPNHTFPPAEALSHDWNKYRDTVIATGGVDGLIRCFDLRMGHGGPYAVLQGHKFAVRRVAWSPQISDLLLSASYDMSCRIWTDGTDQSGGGPRELGSMNEHSEFAMGVDWNMFGAVGWAASCGWDEAVRVWDARELVKG